MRALGGEFVTDPMVYAGVAVSMLVVGMVASATPALHAENVDPNTALRTE